MPPFPHFFGFAPVSIWVWLFMFAMIPFPLAADELRKLVMRRRSRAVMPGGVGEDVSLEQVA